MDRVTSKDGTEIAYDRMGDGPPVVLVCGGSVDRTSNAGLAALLAEDFSVLNYDRRGRGDSGDAAAYEVERELEDLDAVLAAAGGSACLYGSSSGAVLGLYAAASGRPVARLAMWEPPFILEGTRPKPPADTASIYRQFVAEGRRSDAAEFFMAKVVGMPEEFVAQAKASPWWPAQEAMAHTLAYDATIMGDYSLPVDQMAAVTVPAAVLSGGASPDWLTQSARAAADAFPDGRHEVLADQQHNVDPAALAPALKRFFGR
jgi:alpha-beta hydrolase superfamily lysophospholipase